MHSVRNNWKTCVIMPVCKSMTLFAPHLSVRVSNGDFLQLKESMHHSNSSMIP